MFGVGVGQIMEVVDNYEEVFVGTIGYLAEQPGAAIGAASYPARR